MKHKKLDIFLAICLLIIWISINKMMISAQIRYFTEKIKYSRRQFKSWFLTKNIKTIKFIEWNKNNNNNKKLVQFFFSQVVFFLFFSFLFARRAMRPLSTCRQRRGLWTQSLHVRLKLAANLSTKATQLRWDLFVDLFAVSLLLLLLLLSCCLVVLLFVTHIYLLQ